MIKLGRMRRVVDARIADAEALFSRRRYHGAIYLCGYAAEFALKYRICRTLRWPGFPESESDRKRHKTFHLHELDILLTFTACERSIKTTMFADWSTIVKWDPESRYKTSKASKSDARQMIDATTRIVERLFS